MKISISKAQKKTKRILAILGIVSLLVQEVSFVVPVLAAEEIATGSAENQQLTPVPTLAPTLTLAPTPTEEILPSPTLVPTETPSPTIEPTATATLSPTARPTDTPSPTTIPTEIPTSTPTLEPTVTPEPTAITTTTAPTEALTPTSASTPSSSLTPTPTVAVSSASAVLGLTTEAEEEGLFSSIKRLFSGVLGKPEGELKKPFLEKKDFRSNEEVAMSLGDYQPGEIEIRILRNNETIDSLKTKIEDGRLKIIPSANLKPGKYTIKVFSNDTKYLVVEQDFTWGVLAINTNKSVYLSAEARAKADLPPEKVYLQMAALDDSGHTLCDARLHLEILNPKHEIRNFTTDEGTIEKSGECGADNVTDNPDYFAYYDVGSIGNYELKLTNLDNNYEIKDSFVVKESVAFEVERVSATRINPSANYKMNFKIKVNQDFNGTVEEVVPNKFEIRSTKSETPRLRSGQAIQQFNNSTMIIWQVDWKAGNTYELSYEHDAPDISPQTYLLGPLRFYLRESAGNPRESVFAEQRQWQIASDAANDVILLWDTDNGAVPAGWSCISCASTDPMYGVFPMAGSVYGDTAGSDTHNNHSFTFSSQTNGASSTYTGAAGGAKGIIYSHQHTWTGPTIGQGDVRPPFKNLNLIKASSPSVVPANAIVMFDTTSLGVGWTRYSALDGKYLRGNNDNIAGGSEAHTHTISVTSSTYTRDMTDTGNFDDSANDHSHTLSGLTSSTNNQPPYVNVVFAYKGENTAFPIGMIAFFDTTPPGSWTDIGSSAPYLNRFLVGASSGIGNTGGSSASHDHSGTVTITSSSDGTAIPNVGGTGGTNLALAPHTHNVSYTVGSADSLPKYRSLILGKYNPPTITVSGNIYTNETGTAYDCSGGNSKTVKVQVNGSGNYSGTCDAVGGAYSVSDVIVGSAGDVVTVYIDGGSPVFSTTITKAADTTSNISSLPLYQNRVYLTHQNGGPVTNANINQYDSAGDPDIQFVSNGVGLTVSAGSKIVIASGKTYTPGGNIQTPSVGIGGTFSPEANTVDLTGSGTSTTCTDATGTVMPLCLSGTFNPSTSTINFVGGSATTIEDTTYYSVGVGTSAEAGVGATFTLGGNVNVEGTLTVGNASSTNTDTLDASSRTVTLTGSGTPLSITAKGGLTTTGSTINYVAPSATTVSSATYYNLGVGTSAESGVGATFTLGGNVNVGGTFTVGNASSTNTDTLDGSSYTLTLTGAGTPFNITAKGAFTASTSTVDYNGGDSSVQRISGNTTYYNFTATTQNNSSGRTLQFDGSSNTGVGGTWSIIGYSSKVITLQSSDTSNWTINPTAANVTYVDVYRSTNEGVTFCATFSTKDGNTLGWTVGAGASCNENPNSPSSLVQMKTDNTIIDAGTWVNTTSIKIGATVSDADASDTLYLCAEAVGIGVSFTNTETDCGSSVSYSGTPLPATVTLTLSDNTEYHWQVRVKDAASAYSSWVAFGGGVTRDFGTDTSPPTGGTVYDGTEEGVDADFNNGSLSQLSGNWSGINSNVSGLAYYQYAIGTSAGGTDVKIWTSVGTGTSATATGLTLQTSQRYYFNVKAIDNASNTQTAISSDGIIVSPSLTFSVAPATVTFDNLNIGVGWSDSKTTTLTTTTNAYGGYVVRAYTTDFLRSSGVGYTVPEFDGGTYGSPGSWGGGNTGFGYTSSDTTIQGADKFGGGTLYAPLSQTGPGDILADHTDNVTGDPITDEQFTVTHKVKAASTQPAANYVTTVVYTVTAQY